MKLIMAIEIRFTEVHFLLTCVLLPFISGHFISHTFYLYSALYTSTEFVSWSKFPISADSGLI